MNLYWRLPLMHSLQIWFYQISWSSMTWRSRQSAGLSTIVSPFVRWLLFSVFFLTITLLFSPFFSIVGGHMSLFRKFRRKISADEQEIKEKKKCGWSDSGEKVDLMMIRGWLQVLRASECRTIEQGRFSRSTPTTSRRGSRRPRRDSSCCCRLFPPCWPSWSSEIRRRWKNPPPPVDFLFILPCRVLHE